MEKLKEPKFMREIHRIRAELSKMPPTRYEKYLEKVKQKYADRLGHLYVHLPAVKSKRKLETVAR
jgi:hypothetical protein